MAHAPLRDGAKLHYYTLGRGPTVVLLHGFAMPAFLWLPFVTPLAARWRFVLPDLRGFGGSHHLKLANPCLLDQHADDLADLLAHLGESEVMLGGLSMGACTSLQYQRRHGFAGVRAYLHMDQAPCVRNGADWQDGLLGPAQSGKLAEWSGLMRDLEHWRGQAFAQVPAVLRSRLWQTLAEFFSHAFAGRAWQGFSGLARHEALIRRVAPVANWPIYLDALNSYLRDDYDWRPSLPAMRVPMRAFVGMDSTMYPARGQLRLPEWVPHCELVRFERCGHALPFESPRQFIWETTKFLEAHRAVRIPRALAA